MSEEGEFKKRIDVVASKTMSDIERMIGKPIRVNLAEVYPIIDEARKDICGIKFELLYDSRNFGMPVDKPYVAMPNEQYWKLVNALVKWFGGKVKSQ